MLVSSNNPSIAIGYTKFLWSDEEERSLSARDANQINKKHINQIVSRHKKL